ncbi:TonB-dependent siderophore receptor [Herbaspirillum sp. YR522]|uniref:TonB-dependent siderophore receptor n=1 Tax=Herbaspirillum sp. YR522 TaxID=1144342 RepID=UPI00026F996A|nr:TonB-dependent siderophore receptor [Herbaspirillum sp. YR522]EJN09722.1 TonB-dependent siderophore receptor [Herbaspirillum sp. YR522]
MKTQFNLRALALCPRPLTGLTVLAVLLAPGAQLHAQAVDTARLAFEIPAGPLGRALNQFARRAGVLLSFSPQATQERRSAALSGRYTVDEGFAALLAGSGLQAIRQADGAYAIAAIAASADPLPQVVVAAQQESVTGQLGGLLARRAASAMKTDTPILETPQSLSVATADQIEATKAQSLAEALDYTPGVISQASSFNRMVDDVRVRGFNLANANTGMLRDGMKYQPSVYDSSQEPYGLERLEVLRGAASVLYGQLSPGGVINAVSKRPTADPYHEITADIGSNHRRQVTGDFSGPLSQDGAWSYRLTALVRQADTGIDHIDDNKTYLAPALTWRPSARTSLTLLGSYQHMRTRFVAPASAALTVNGTIPRNFFIGEPGYDRYDSEVYSGGYVFEHAFDDDLKLRHNLRYFNGDAVFNYLSYGTLNASTGLTTRGVVNRAEKSEGLTTDTSLEMNFGSPTLRHKVLAGIDYFDSTYDSKRYAGTVAAINMRNPVYGATPVIGTANNGSRTESQQFGLYLQDQMKLADKLVWLGGARQDWVDSSVTTYGNNRRTPARDSALTARTGLVYFADNGLAPYASFGQSFAPQAGGDRLGNNFKPTESDQFEVGIRYQPQGGRTLMSAALYQIDQTNGLTVDPVDSTYSVQTAELRSRGLELEARSTFGRLDLIANYTYTDARTTRSNLASEIGQRVSGVPYHAASTWAQYDFGGVGLPGMKAGVGVRYQGQVPVAGLSSQIAGRTLVDAMLAYDLQQLGSAWRGLQLKINAKNLFNRDYVQCVAATGCRYGEERNVIATISYRW